MVNVWGQEVKDLGHFSQTKQFRTMVFIDDQ